jgi:outer membrane receptor for Fe3+-dicitrate
VSENIIIGGVHTWTLTSGTGAYDRLRGTGIEGGAPDSSNQIHVLMNGTVTH